MPVPHWKKLIDIYRKDIWLPSNLTDKSPRGRLYAIARVISITVTGLIETKSASRAAALSFSSLLGLGPLVAIAMLVAGFMLDKQDPELAAKTLSSLIEKIAPQIKHLKSAGQLPDAPSDNPATIISATTQTAGGPTQDTSEVAQMIDADGTAVLLPGEHPPEIP